MSVVGIREAAWSKAQSDAGKAKVLDNKAGDGGVPQGTWAFAGSDTRSARMFLGTGTELKASNIGAAVHLSSKGYSQKGPL